MTGENRTPLNPLFCEYHYSQYRSDTRANSDYAIKAVSALAMHNPGILEAVGVVMNTSGATMEQATRLVLESMQKTYNRALCCYLGDPIMEKVLKASKNPPPGWKA